MEVSLMTVLINLEVINLRYARLTKDQLQTLFIAIGEGSNLKGLELWNNNLRTLTFIKMSSWGWGWGNESVAEKFRRGFILYVIFLYFSLTVPKMSKEPPLEHQSDQPERERRDESREHSSKRSRDISRDDKHSSREGRDNGNRERKKKRSPDTKSRADDKTDRRKDRDEPKPSTSKSRDHEHEERRKDDESRRRRRTSRSDSNSQERSLSSEKEKPKSIEERLRAIGSSSGGGFKFY